MPPESGGICGILTQDLPLGHLQGGYGVRDWGLGDKFNLYLFLLYFLEGLRVKSVEFRVSGVGFRVEVVPSQGLGLRA